MANKRIKTDEKSVGANCIRPRSTEMTRNKNNNGITLIALIITIIVMLILVAVSVTVALNGGLFTTAKDAKTNTQIARDEELKLDDGQIEVDGKKYASYQDYLDKKEMLILPTGWSVAETKPEGWSEKVTAITDGTNIVPLPNGFKLSTEETEDSIEEGLVLKDGANEFVWVPVENSTSYTENSFGPLTDTDSTTKYVYDSYQEIQYYYGDALGTINSDDAFNTTFTYASDKTNVETSIQKYGGFYVGRYETTYDSVDENNVPQGIGIKQGKNILTTASILQPGTNSTSNDEYHYRWWGLYKAQKDMYTNNQAVGSLMISSKQWDAIMAYTSYGDTIRPTNTYTSNPDLSGSAYFTDNTQYDVSKNIYDLAGNVREFTLKASSAVFRIIRGGYCYNSSTYSASYSYDWYPYFGLASFGSRATLYIK